MFDRQLEGYLRARVPALPLYEAALPADVGLPAAVWSATTGTTTSHDGRSSARVALRIDTWARTRDETRMILADLRRALTGWQTEAAQVARVGGETIAVVSEIDAFRGTITADVYTS